MIFVAGGLNHFDNGSHRWSISWNGEHFVVDIVVIGDNWARRCGRLAAGSHFHVPRNWDSVQDGVPCRLQVVESMNLLAGRVIDFYRIVFVAINDWRRNVFGTFNEHLLDIGRTWFQNFRKLRHILSININLPHFRYLMAPDTTATAKNRHNTTEIVLLIVYVGKFKGNRC